MADKSLSILIVDDNQDDADFLMNLLRGDATTSFSVEHADRLIPGLERMESGGIDLVILDLFLPDSKGIKTLHKMLSRAKNTAIIALTRLDDAATGVAAVRDGAQDFLIKGEVSDTLLIRAIRHAIERKQTEISLRESEERYRGVAEKLEEAYAELETFSYSVSHDLRAPLRAITGFAEIINRRFRVQLNEDGQRYLENIIESGKQMGWLIDDLLAYSRIGSSVLDLEPIHIDELIRQVLESLAATIHEHKAAIAAPDDLPVLTGNRILLKQIFQNLITNAATFHKEGVAPQIEISYQREHGMHTFHIADNGIGIPEEHQERIYNLFQRLHVQEEYPGTGIGLAIVKKAVKKLHGQISVKSKVNEGATFSVKLPG